MICGRVKSERFYQKKSKNFGDNIFVILSIHKPSLGHLRSHKKCGPNRYSRFDVYRLQTNRQTDKQSIHFKNFLLKGVYLNIVEEIKTAMHQLNDKKENLITVSRT